MAVVRVAYRFALDPSPAQERTLRSHAGAARFAFVKSKRGQRKGKKLGFPRYKKRGRSRDSFRLTGTIRCERNTVRLPRLGVVATHELTGKLMKRVAAGTARVLSATVSRTAQRWYMSFTVAEDRDIPARHARPGTAIGIDLGIKTLITGVDNAGTAGHAPPNLEPGTPSAGKTGTAARQQAAA